MGTPNLDVLAAQLIRASRAQGVSTSALAAALRAMKLEDVPAGGLLYREGARSESLHVLVEGTVRILVGPEQREMTRLQAPTVVGQLGLLTGLPRSATVAAEGSAQILRLGHRELWDLIRGSSDAGLALRRVLLAGLAQLVGQTGGRLGELAAEHGEPIPKGETRIPSAVPMRRRKQAPEAADVLAGTFSTSLIAELDNIRLVQSEADLRQRYKG